MSPQDPTTWRRTPLRFSVEHWAAIWANPHPDLAGRVVTPDVLAAWPGDPEPLRGVTAYKRRIAHLLQQAPGLRLEVAEHARAGQVLFIRWTAHRRGQPDPGLTGVDWIRLRDGLIAEHRVYYDPTRIQNQQAGDTPPDDPTS